MGLQGVFESRIYIKRKKREKIKIEELDIQAYNRGHGLQKGVKFSYRIYRQFGLLFPATRFFSIFILKRELADAPRGLTLPVTLTNFSSG